MTLFIPDTYCEMVVGFTTPNPAHQASVTLAFHLADTDLVGAVSDFADAWSAHMAGGALCESYAIDTYELRTAESSLAVPGPGPGSGTFDCVSPNTAILVKKQSALRGREHAGRSYLPGGYLDEGDVDEAGVISDAAVIAMQDNIAAVFSDLDASTHVGAFVILHTSELTAPDNVVLYKVESLAATQRRRMR